MHGMYTSNQSLGVGNAEHTTISVAQVNKQIRKILHFIIQIPKKMLSTNAISYTPSPTLP